MQGNLYFSLVIILCITYVYGHGRLLDPPSRSSMWRLGFNTPPNYSDNQLFCGGVGVQYSKAVGGKCGVCGDPYPGPRANEAGGKYATGVIVRKYQMGATISIQIQITANHKGWTEFKLCPTNNKDIAATQGCMDQNVLQRADGQGSRFPVEASKTGMFYFSVILPPAVTCSQCVLQWRYHTANSWGTDPDGTSCVGCGNQEEFYACADIEITSSSVMVPMTDPVKPVTMPMNDPRMTDYDDWEWDTDPQTTPATSDGAVLIKSQVFTTIVLITMWIIIYI